MLLVPNSTGIYPPKVIGQNDQSQFNSSVQNVSQTNNIKQVTLCYLWSLLQG